MEKLTKIEKINILLNVYTRKEISKFRFIRNILKLTKGVKWKTAVNLKTKLLYIAKIKRNIILFVINALNF